jgi:NarL family two-component system response regulator LiaR
MARERIRLLLVEDHAVVRRGLRAFLEAQPEIEVVGEAASGAESIALATQQLPDVVLMGLNMLHPQGIEAARQITAANPQTQVIALTGYSQNERMFTAINQGSPVCLPKDIEPDELVRTILSARQGAAAYHAGDNEGSVARRYGAMVSPLDELTERERDVLACIARGMNNAEIAQHLIIGQRTVKTHVSNILSKLQLQDRTQAAVMALRERLDE